jgi:hypothetical protein
MVGFGAAKPPQDLHFRVVCAGFAGTYHAKECYLEGLRPAKPPAWQATA